MTATPDELKGQKLFMTGLGLVMGGLIFGGGLAMVFYFLNLRPAAIGAALLGVALAGAGVWLQVTGAKLLRSKRS